MQALLAGLFTIFAVLSASAASAVVAWTITAESEDGSALGALQIGSRVIVDITARNDGEAIFGISASAFGYDSTFVTLVPEDSILATSLFGILNQIVIPAPDETGPNSQTRFFDGASLGGATGTGESDLSPITGLVGGPQFRLVFEVTTDGLARFVTPIGIGSSQAYGDAVIGAGGVPSISNNALVELSVVPEPATSLLLGLGLAGLARRARVRFSP